MKRPLRMISFLVSFWLAVSVESAADAFHFRAE